jgi:undecaprenyl diphosphate synthase
MSSATLAPSNLTEEGRNRLAAIGLNQDQLPRHVAIIMDGNGRWAQERGLPRVFGHRRGIQSVRAVSEECRRLGLKQLTLYCLSVENWKRPPRELKFLMRLLRHFLVVERDELASENIRLVMIGEREGLPPDVLAEMDRTVEMTRNNTGMTLALAVNYGGRTEIAKAARRIAEKVARGELLPSDINESLFDQHLDTAGMPDPDLLIRTAGEMRVSNYLLWQISYSELWVTETNWPDFREDHLAESFHAYAGRKRKFGGLIKG